MANVVEEMVFALKLVPVLNIMVKVIPENVQAILTMLNVVMKFLVLLMEKVENVYLLANATVKVLAGYVLEEMISNAVLVEVQHHQPQQSHQKKITHIMDLAVEVEELALILIELVAKQEQ